MKSYKIIRFYHPTQNKKNKIIDAGLTLKEAQEHCSSPETMEKFVFFDGYEEE